MGEGLLGNTEKGVGSEDKDLAAFGQCCPRGAKSQAMISGGFCSESMES